MGGHGKIRELVLRSGHLRRATTAASALQDPAVHEHLPTPDAPGLMAGDRTLETLEHHRAGGADALGGGDVLELLGEEDAGERPVEVVAGGFGPDSR